MLRNTIANAWASPIFGRCSLRLAKEYPTTSENRESVLAGLTVLAGHRPLGASLVRDPPPFAAVSRLLDSHLLFCRRPRRPTPVGSDRSGCQVQASRRFRGEE